MGYVLFLAERPRRWARQPRLDMEQIASFQRPETSGVSEFVTPLSLGPPLAGVVEL